jgi:hypothetical protein
MLGFKPKKGSSFRLDRKLGSDKINSKNKMIIEIELLKKNKHPLLPLRLIF